MANQTLHQAALALLKHSVKPLSLAEISQQLNEEVPHRTLRRWLSKWVTEAVVARTGTGRATRYRYIEQFNERDVRSPHPFPFSFLKSLDNDLKTSLINQIRDLWTHTSTAIEGNTLSLGDTHFILEQGLTISGKPIREHQEIIGHAKAIELLYQCLDKPLTEAIVFDLHRAVQTESIFDIYKPNGAWKVEPNGTHALSPNGQQIFIDYALPVFVPALMEEIIQAINSIESEQVKLCNAHVYYAKIHMGIAHIHPFWDGNGRIARLLANIPLLKAGLPPLVIPQQQRRIYIQSLANYQITLGQLNKGTGVWPDSTLLDEFSDFCAACYNKTKELVDAAFETQNMRL